MEVQGGGVEQKKQLKTKNFGFLQGSHSFREIKPIHLKSLIKFKQAKQGDLK